MSTKIYNGYKLPSMNLKQLQDFTMDLRQKMKLVSIKITEELISQIAVNMIDTLTLKGEEEFLNVFKKDKKYLNYSAFFNTYLNIYDKNKKIKETEQRNPTFDLECSICFIPSNRKILCLFYSENEEYAKIWENSEFVKYYGYWNNVEKPKKVTKNNGKIGKKDWDVALPGIGIPSKNGFLATLVGEVPSFIDLNINNIIKNIKSLEDRALSQAKNISISDKMNELAENESVDKMNLYFKAIDWLKTEEGKEALLKKTESVKEKLIPVITEDILNVDLKELIKGCI